MPNRLKSTPYAPIELVGTVLGRCVMGRPRWTSTGTPLLAVLTRHLTATNHSVRTLFVVGTVLLVLAVLAIVLGAWGGRRRK